MHFQLLSNFPMYIVALFLAYFVSCLNVQGQNIANFFIVDVSTCSRPSMPVQIVFTSLQLQFGMSQFCFERNQKVSAQLIYRQGDVILGTVNITLTSLHPFTGYKVDVYTASKSDTFYTEFSAADFGYNWYIYDFADHLQPQGRHGYTGLSSTSEDRLGNGKSLRIRQKESYCSMAFLFPKDQNTPEGNSNIQQASNCEKPLPGLKFIRQSFHRILTFPAEFDYDQFYVLKPGYCNEKEAVTFRRSDKYPEIHFFLGIPVREISTNAKYNYSVDFNNFRVTVKMARWYNVTVQIEDKNKNSVFGQYSMGKNTALLSTFEMRYCHLFIPVLYTDDLLRVGPAYLILENVGSRELNLTVASSSSPGLTFFMEKEFGYIDDFEDLNCTYNGIEDAGGKMPILETDIDWQIDALGSVIIFGVMSFLIIFYVIFFLCESA